MSASRKQPSAGIGFEAIYRDHFHFVCGIARKLGGPGIEVDDVAQEVFLVVARRLGSFDSRAAQVTTWLYGITLNVVRSLRRRARSRIVLQPSDDAAAATLIEPERADRTQVIDAYKIAARVFRQMTPAKREAFFLAEFAELTCAEIGELVGVQEATVWSRLHYARREFRALLALGAEREKTGAAA